MNASTKTDSVNNIQFARLANFLGMPVETWSAAAIVNKAMERINRGKLLAQHCEDGLNEFRL